MENGKLLDEWKDENSGEEYVKLERKKKAAKLQAAFRRLDADGSGLVDAEELWTLVKEVFADHSDKVQQGFYDTIVREVDVDKDGNLSYSEFVSSEEGERVMRLIELADSSKKVETAFAKVDKDNSGLIDRNELRTLLRMCFPRAKEDTIQLYYSSILSDCDKDRSGTISLDEFLLSTYMDTIARAIVSDEEKSHRAKETVLLHFQKLDVDGSGHIDGEELEELLKKCFPVAGKEQRDKYLRAILLECDKDQTGTIEFTEFVNTEYVDVLAQGLYEDYERREKKDKGATKRRGRPKKPLTRKTHGLKGGVVNRCAATSPRRASKPDMYQATKATDRLDKLKNRLPGVERKEADNFKPKGLSGDFLLQKAEDTIEDAPAVSTQWADAEEYFEDAAEAYEREENYGAAGEAWTRASDCFAKLGRPLEEAACLIKAAEQYRQVQPQEAVDSLNEAIDIYEEHEHTKQVARLHRTIAEILESIQEYDDAIEYYEEAVELYGECGDSNNNNLPLQFECLRRLAQIFVRATYYDRAVKMYERLADITVQDNIGGNPALGRLEVRDFYLRAVLCLLCSAPNNTGLERLTGVEEAQQKFRKYTNDDLEGFNQGQEYLIAKNMIELSLKQDATGMQHCIEDYKKWSVNRTNDGIKVEDWVMDLLLIIFDKLLDWLDRAGQGLT